MYCTLENYHSFSDKEHFHEMNSITAGYSHETDMYSIRVIQHAIDEPIKSFHQPISQPFYGEQELVIASMKQNGEYRFYSDCCKLHTLNYMKNEHIEEGIAINGVFYQFHKDSKPIGFYKQFELEIENEIPESYRRFYRAITLKDGVVEIHAEPIDQMWSRRADFDSLMVSAPLLIDRGQLAITDSVLENEKINETHLLLCDISKANEKGMHVHRGEKKIQSCSNNRPGGLFHIANANPRSAIVTDRSGNVHFVRVAGRQTGKLGMDVVQLGQAILKYIPEAWMALNLDGGAPSQLLHKTPEKIVMTQNQHSHTTNSTILVGNLLAYLKTGPEFRLRQK